MFRDYVYHFLFMCILLVIVSSAFSCLFLFSLLSVVSGVSVLRLLDFLGPCPCCSSSASFLRHQLHVLTCISFYPILVCSPPPAFLGSSGFRLYVGFAFSCGSGCGSTFSLPFCLHFSACCGSGCSLQPYSAFFPHAVATVDCSVLPPCFSACCSFGCPFLFLSPFSVSCASSCSFWSSSLFFRILRLWLLFAFGTPPVVFRAADSLLAVPRLSGCCFPCVSASFLLLGFHRLLRFSSLSLGLRSLPWCLFLLLFVVVFFAPALVLSPPVLPCSVGVAFWLSFLTCSNLRFPSRRGLPLGRFRFASASVFLGFELPACAGILSVFVSSSFLCLVRVWTSLIVVFTRWVASGFLGAPSSSMLVLSWVISCSFLFM